MGRIVAAVALVLWGVFSLAAPTRAQAPSSEAMIAAREVVDAMQATKQFKALLPIVAQQLKPAIVQGRPEVERAYDSIMPLMREAAETRLNELTDAVALIYARHFTAEELRQLLAFYRTPAGQKILEKNPVIAQDTMIAGQKFGESIAQEMNTKAREELRRRGHKI